MYSSLSDILQTFSVRFPLLWAVLVVAVMTATSLALYGAWELTVGWLPFNWSRSRKPGGR